MGVLRKLTTAACAVIVSTSAVAWGAEPTVLLLPFERPADAHRDLGFGVELGVLSALRATGSVNVVHPKIRDSVMRRHTSAANAPMTGRREAFARYVGATWTLEGTVAQAPAARISLRMAPVAGGKPIEETVAAPSMAEALDALPDAVLRLVNATDKGQRKLRTPVTPKTTPEALARLATCYRMLNEQSVGILRPALINDVRVQQAGNRCWAALRRAPDLVEAEAGLAMVDALQGRADDAKARLAKIKDHPGFLSYYWIAKFWVLAKFFSPEQAVRSLREAIKRNPGFMLGRSYLGEALSAMGRHEDALQTYRDYLERIPEQPFVMARIGHELARLDRHDEAIRVTKEALQRNPENAEIRLQYGSRLIDAGKLKAAVEVLSALVEQSEVRGEAYLRLGYAQLETGRLPEAEKAFRQALEKSTAPQEWRTRGRAHFDLAKLHARRKNVDAALNELTLALDEGFKRPKLFSKDSDLEAVRTDERYAMMMERNPRPPEIPLQYKSPFLVDAAEVVKAAVGGGVRPGRTVDF